MAMIYASPEPHHGWTLRSTRSQSRNGRPWLLPTLHLMFLKTFGSSAAKGEASNGSKLSSGMAILSACRSGSMTER